VIKRNALIVFGGWPGHHPHEMARLYDRILQTEGFETELCDSLSVFGDAPKLAKMSLLVPCWSMGKIDRESVQSLFDAVKSGLGVAGCHGGMCDAFRENTEWQFMTGGQWVAHPGNDLLPHRIKIGPGKSTITDGIGDFDVATEQYYMHVDPAVKVLATTEFPVADGPHVGNGTVQMPVIWTKLFASGRIFYSSLGHTTSIVEMEPHLTLLRRGFQWAAR
jgi:type 1 glutamine amidotransferase